MKLENKPINSTLKQYSQSQVEQYCADHKNIIEKFIHKITSNKTQPLNEDFKITIEGKLDQVGKDILTSIVNLYGCDVGDQFVGQAFDDCMTQALLTCDDPEIHNLVKSTWACDDEDIPEEVTSEEEVFEEEPSEEDIPEEEVVDGDIDLNEWPSILGSKALYKTFCMAARNFACQCPNGTFDDFIGQFKDSIEFDEGELKDFRTAFEEGRAACQEIEAKQEVPLEEAIALNYYRITYKHPTGIYSTIVVYAGSQDDAEDKFNQQHEEEIVAVDKISKQEYQNYIDSGAEVLEECLEVEVEDDCKEVEVKQEDDKTEISIENRQCDQDQVEEEEAEEDQPSDMPEEEKQLQELSRDPKYAAAFKYLINTLHQQSDSVDEEQPEEQPEEESGEESGEESEVEEEGEIITEGVEETSDLQEGSEQSEEVPEPPAAPGGIYIANEINDLIKGELDAINLYNNFLVDLEGAMASEGSNLEQSFADSAREIIKDILAEENLHIGQLQELLKPISPNAENIEDGADEAQEQINTAQEDQNEES